MRGLAGSVVDYRGQLDRILASKSFASSRQLQDFLRFTGELVFEGRTHVDQAEIALRLLGKSADFNPVEDASVRRIATVTRQRLAQYYEAEGAADPIVVTLPHRSYLPAFAIVARSVPAPPPPPARRWLTPALVLAIPLVLGLAGWNAFRPPATSPLLLTTGKGEITGPINYVQPGAIFAGPTVAAGEFADSLVRLRFIPEHATQQAGLMWFQDLDNFVRLGRVFNSRVSWEFDAETAGRQLRPPGTWTYDPLGQDGSAVWLAIRRNGNRYRAMTSVDGRRWEAVGNPLETALPTGRLAVYGMNGINDTPGIPATFERASRGLQFNALPDELPTTSALPGWKLNSSCGAGVDESIGPGGLRLAFTRHEPCSWNLSHTAPEGDWTVTTLLDFSPLGGAQAGLTLGDDSGPLLRFVRSAGNGGIVTVEFPGRRLVRSLPDFPGHPPILLRLAARTGALTAGFSRDGVTFTDIPLGLRAADLGKQLRYGLDFYLTTWNQLNPVAATAAARFEYVREEFQPIEHSFQSVHAR